MNIDLSSSSDDEHDHRRNQKWELTSESHDILTSSALLSGFTRDTNLSTTKGTKRQVVFIQDYDFVPKKLEIDTETIIEFRLEKSIPAHAEHSIEGRSSVKELNFASPLMQKNDLERWQFSPVTPGRISVSCSIYRDMECTVVVNPISYPGYAQLAERQQLSQDYGHIMSEKTGEEFPSTRSEVGNVNTTFPCSLHFKMRYSNIYLPRVSNLFQYFHDQVFIRRQPECCYERYVFILGK